MILLYTRQQLLYRLYALLILLGLVTTLQAQPVIQGNWSMQADAYAGQAGKRFTFYFPPGGTISSRIWGTDVYTTDGSIATAAVHAGLITTRNGGTVTIEIKPGQSSYKGTLRNGVTSRDWGAYGASFVFVTGTTTIPMSEPIKVIEGNWNTQANAYNTTPGKQYTFRFPPGGSISSRLWGTDIYTSDGSIATAAVHAGLITTKDGGTVTIEMKEGQPSYKGSVRNGVTSAGWGAYGSSFIFVNGPGTIPPVLIDADAIRGDWTTQANAYAANVGKRYKFYFPPGGTVSGRVWGTDVYTYDCSIASAAVHAGLITVEKGGTVTIEIRPGQPSYRGSTRNGVTSKDWGAFGGSFIFVQ